MEKVMMYMPVADDTFGGTPMASRRGLKMTPPPRPRAPATHPPKKPSVKTFLRVLPSKTKSLSARLMLPYFFFSCYYLATYLTANTTIDTITMTKRVKNIQSALLHLSKPMLPLPPLKRLWSSKKVRQIRLMPCLAH